MAESFMQQLIASLARRTPVLDEAGPYGLGASETEERSRRPAKPHLLAEDREDFERTLDEVLAAESHGRPARLDAEQLRRMALAASELIAATAATEYAQYVEVRERVRNPRGSDGLLTDGPSAEQPGASLTAVIAVLAPVLFGSAAVIFLLVGFVLGMANPKPSIASTMLTTGWVFGAATAASLLLGMIGLLVAALRNRPSYEEWATRNEEVATARDIWRQALRRRGIEPFLREVGHAVSRSLDHDQAP
ncbi:hypothetical protein SAMN04487981_101532 [Streptomyces sp. cf386]|uniref:hypothetical protein n=1 Tax=Streptomyces sp. cf386 TaxID=1761904 RepID=UPI00088AA0A3|nr:hypothetical protein [Streptomyces sp. cf386]SDM44246.1 hypothetical protein SAMN04487981_101532 [Streptomyces sp. cf386]